MRPLTALDGPNQEFFQLLKRSGWTQSEAARQLSLTPAAVSRYLSGATRPSMTVLRLFEMLLMQERPGGVGSGYRAGAQPNPSRPDQRVVPRPAVEDPLHSLAADELELIQTLRALPEKARAQTVEALRVLLHHDSPRTQEKQPVASASDRPTTQPSTEFID